MSNRAKELKNRRDASFIAFCAVLALSPLLAWGFFTFPMNDDFSHARWDASWAGLHQQFSDFHAGLSGL